MTVYLNAITDANVAVRALENKTDRTPATSARLGVTRSSVNQAAIGFDLILSLDAI
jgi:hypothetical protein